MSYTNYEKALKLAKKCDYYYIAGGKDESIIREAEKVLDIKFSNQFYNYLNNVGYLSFFGNEFYGITSTDFTNKKTDLNAVVYALVDREEYNLPKEWIPIYSFDDGYMAYLDYGHLNEDFEPRVIMGIYTGIKYEMVDVIAEEFGDFLLQQVVNQLTYQ